MTSTTSTSTTPTSTTGSPKTSRRLVAALVAGGVALAGITAAVTMTLATPEAHAQPAVTTSSSSTSTTTHGSATSHPSHGQNGHHTRPAVPWSQSTKTLQSQLAQLNYYDGHITGYWNAETTDAVTYLQASAHLPQTGTMNTATQAALDYQLVHGDNQMGN